MAYLRPAGGRHLDDSQPAAGPPLDAVAPTPTRGGSIPFLIARLSTRIRQSADRIGLGPRLAGAFLLVAGLTVATGTISLLGLARASEASRLLDQSAAMLASGQDLRAAIEALPGPPSNYLLTGDPAARARFDSAAVAVRAQLAGYASQATAAGTGPDVYSLAAVAAQVDAAERLGLEIFQTNGGGAAQLAALEQQVTLATTRLQPLLGRAQEGLIAARAAYPNAQRTAAAGLLVSVLLAVALALGLAWYSTRRLTEPLANLAEASTRIAAGDLATPVPSAGPGELGQLAAAFERMRRMLVHERDRARRLAILEERDRIGREMHDGLAQVLGYVNTKAQAAREFLKADQADSASQQLEELIVAAREGYADAREAIADLRVEGVAERSLADLLAEHVSRFHRQSGVPCELTVAPDWRDAELAPSARVQVLRIVQEALTNARKHADATCVRVSVEVYDNQALVRIADDGRGFPLSRLLSPDFARYGLRTMRERAQAVGGSLRIESLPGEGTRIILHVPLAGPEGTEDR
jgi:signal transduction histidine kinase